MRAKAVNLTKARLEMLRMFRNSNVLRPYPVMRQRERPAVRALSAMGYLLQRPQANGEVWYCITDKGAAALAEANARDDAALLVDGNAWYSDAQREEMGR